MGRNLRRKEKKILGEGLAASYCGRCAMHRYVNGAKSWSKMILYSHLSIVKIASNISSMYAMSSSLYPQSADLVKNTDNF